MRRFATTLFLLVAIGCGAGSQQAAPAANDAAEADRDPAALADWTRADGGAPEALRDQSPTDAGAVDAGDGAGQEGLDVPADSADAAGPCAVSVTPSPGIVVTDRGAVRGQQVAETWAFLGIPYAAPPVAELRWRAPKPHACWDGVRDATQWAPACMQADPKTGQAVGAEDCLVVNVWTPADATPEKPLPVMFFVHGGGNIQGSSGETIAGGARLYDGAYLASHARAVVVTANYRLGALGYLAIPELAAESPDGVSGNYGILDLIRALEWVRDNIRAFGGDPARVLLFGESAGAVNTCVLLASPLAKGLFHAALMQSGGCSVPLAASALQGSEQFVAKTPCAGVEDRLACLRGLSAEQVTLALPGHIALGDVDFNPDQSVKYGPHVDGHVLPAPPLDRISSGEHNHVPFMIGSNADEVEQAIGVKVSSVEEYEAAVAAAFAFWGDAVANAVLRAYPAADFESPQKALVAIVTDLKFTCPARAIARAVQRAQAEPVFRYFFTRRPAVANGDLGAVHGIELMYLFHTLTKVPLYIPAQADLDLADAIIGYWGRFAAAGDPNGDGAPEWPSYDSQKDTHLVLDSPPRAGEGVRTERCDFWDALLAGNLPPETPSLFDMPAIRDATTAQCTFENPHTVLKDLTLMDVWNVSYLSWESVGGALKPIRIRGYAARPSGAGALPGVVLAHGLGGYAEESSAVGLAQLLRAFVIAYSGPGSGSAPENTSEGLPPTHENGYRLWDTLQDPRGSWFWGHSVAAMRALTCLQARPDVDPARLGVTGYSAGAIASLIVAGADDRVRAAVPVSGTGAFDVATQSPAAWQHALLAKAGLTTDSPEWKTFLETLDPAVIVSGAKGAVLIVNGSVDEFFPLTAHLATYDALPGTEKRTSLVANADHGCYAIVPWVEDKKTIEDRVAVHAAGGQMMWFGHHFGSDPDFADVPLPPEGQVTGAGAAMIVTATVDRASPTLDVEEVTFWASNDDAYTFWPFKLDFYANTGVFGAIVPAPLQPNTVWFLDAQYKTKDLLWPKRFTISSRPSVPPGFVPHIRAMDSCL